VTVDTGIWQARGCRRHLPNHGSSTQVHLGSLAIDRTSDATLSQLAIVTRKFACGATILDEISCRPIV
jgi:hypothetical protein